MFWAACDRAADQSMGGHESGSNTATPTSQFALGASSSVKMLRFLLMTLLLLMHELAAVAQESAEFDYSDALDKALLFYEGQRSGKLPDNQRMTWRGDSGLTDGTACHVDLTGGYYDAGDNVKYQFPMAFTITLLAWTVVEYESELAGAGQLQHAHESIKWATDYFLKAVTGPTQIWVQVGDPNTDHLCWERPEDMDTPRPARQINATAPGTEVAAETAAALAAASIVFSGTNPAYAQTLLATAKTVFDFANRYRGTYTGACPFYCSASGYNDELLWAAAWLYKASKDGTYLRFLVDNIALDIEMNEFSWDNKYAGTQILLSKLYWAGEGSLEHYATLAALFVCHVLPYNAWSEAAYTPGGLLYVRNGANTQYVTGSAFIISVYADYLERAGKTLTCGHTTYEHLHLLAYCKSQVDYLLGENLLHMSYMAGFGPNHPTQVHHRSASIISIHNYPEHIGCGEGFVNWFHMASPNPNVLTGALVGGPGSNDEFLDHRTESSYTEPTTYINSGLVGLLARLLR